MALKHNPLKKLSLFIMLIVLTSSLPSCAIYTEIEQRNFSLLKLLYNRYGSFLRWFITNPSLISKIAGWYADSSISKKDIDAFIKKYDIDIKEIEEPLESFESFNGFFTRKIKPEARPINQDPLMITSPADGLVYAAPNITPETEVLVKGKSFDLEALLQNEHLAQNFYGGTLVVIYLGPWDYHRFHFPCDAYPYSPKRINGIYESVNPLVYTMGIQPLTENERHLIMLKTTDNQNIAFLPVGALCVGRITETYQTGRWYKKGEEAGYFSFGGSTIVLVFPKDFMELHSTIASHTFTPIKMGQPLGYRQ